MNFYFLTIYNCTNINKVDKNEDEKITIRIRGNKVKIKNDPMNEEIIKERFYEKRKKGIFTPPYETLSQANRNFIEFYSKKKIKDFNFSTLNSMKEKIDKLKLNNDQIKIVMKILDNLNRIKKDQQIQDLTNKIVLSLINNNVEIIEDLPLVFFNSLINLFDDFRKLNKTPINCDLIFKRKIKFLENFNTNTSNLGQFIFYLNKFNVTLEEKEINRITKLIIKLNGKSFRDNIQLMINIVGLLKRSNSKITEEVKMIYYLFINHFRKGILDSMEEINLSIKIKVFFKEVGEFKEDWEIINGNIYKFKNLYLENIDSFLDLIRGIPNSLQFFNYNYLAIIFLEFENSKIDLEQYIEIAEFFIKISSKIGRQKGFDTFKKLEQMSLRFVYEDPYINRILTQIEDIQIAKSKSANLLNLLI